MLTRKTILMAACVAALGFSLSSTADVSRSEANNGNLIMEDIPPIPEQVIADLNRYQNTRSAAFRGWDEAGDGVFISTRFGDVSQIHHVDRPGGARTQLTFFAEPIGGLSRQPKGSQMVFTMDAGGSEFSQIFLLDPTGVEDAVMLTDGESRNGAVVWDRNGERIAYQSTRRNGASNDIWMMNVNNPASASVVLESPDGTWWGGVDFSPDNSHLLVVNYVSASDSRVHLLDLDSREHRMLAGDPENGGANLPLGFDKEGAGFFFLTDRAGEFQQLAWQSIKEGSQPVILTRDIPWDISGGAISEDRTRAAFVVNQDGFSRLYLMNPADYEYRAVKGVPTGLIGSLEFSPDGSSLGMTMNTPQTPSDTFTLALAENPLAHGDLTRWTYSEVGRLDTESFVVPELVRYPTFDSDKGGPATIPAWVYRPRGEGPHPVIIDIHGGPEGQSRPGFSSTLQMWIGKLGAAVIEPNVRGSDGYGKTYLSLDNGFKREDSVKDIGALLDWIATQPDLDENRVAVFGGSYGGYMVLASAVHYSDRLKAAVDVVGISNFVTFLENTQDYRRDLRRVEYGDERDPEMRKHLEAISPLNHVEKINVPMFVIQGQNDPRVPVTEAEQVVEALRASGQPVWYMNALNEGHGYRKKENRDLYQQAVVLFFQEHLVSTGGE
ncbi:MAG: S9 family peptidase [Xanthomonadales bacterium]|nr:prolyl oligopeptidase family serine peptidase [Gammaproteobacteria bacterium]NNL05122.1 S9 family peptidase [Xanthomonadales bacterium]